MKLTYEKQLKVLNEIYKDCSILVNDRAVMSELFIRANIPLFGTSVFKYYGTFEYVIKTLMSVLNEKPVLKVATKIILRRYEIIN